MLRQMARILDARHEYMLYTDRPGHGMTAAFLLACRGIAAGILRDVALARKHAPWPASYPVTDHA
jgi:hypothetical protein